MLLQILQSIKLKGVLCMNKRLSKVLMVLLAVIITLSSVPVSSISQIASGSSVGVIAEAASEKTHLNKTKKSVYIGKKYTLKLIDKNGKTISNSKIKWSRSNKTVASVSKKGVVTGKKAGKIKITATYKGEKYTAVITVKSAVSLSKSKITFKAGDTAKKTIKVTCMDSEGIKWKTVEGSGIVTLSQAKKWKNNSKSLYITPTGKKFGTVKIKIYSKENSNSYDYITIEVKKPYTLKVKNSVPCSIKNYANQEKYEDGVRKSSLKITNVSYKTPDTKTLKVTVAFEARYSKKIEDYYFIRYRVFDKDGYLVKSGRVKSELMMVGDKAKEVVTLKNLDNGSYTIKFVDYIGSSSSDSSSSNTSPSVPDNDTTTNNGNLTADEALAMYQNAAKEIRQRGVAGYSKKSWQTIDSMNTSNSALNGTLGSLLEGFLTTEEAAEVKVNEKGSDDAKLRMPISDCSKNYIKSVTTKCDGDNYVITIVMKECVNPSYDDNDGLARMSRDFLDMKDVEATIKYDETVSALVRSFDNGEITYKDYTIKAVMTKDGKFVSIEHFGPADISADMAMIVGNVSIWGSMSFYVKYYDFKY